MLSFGSQPTVKSQHWRGNFLKAASLKAARHSGAKAFNKGMKIWCRMLALSVLLPVSAVCAENDAPDPSRTNKVISTGGGKYQFTIDTSAAPDLTDWALKELAPVV